MLLATSAVVTTAAGKGSSMLEAALTLAVAEARRCGVDIDAADVQITRSSDGRYKVEFFRRGIRGGVAQVNIGPKASSVEKSECTQ